MIRCGICEGLVRQRMPEVWVHVDALGSALSSELVWPRDHQPRPMRRMSASRVAFDEAAEPDLRWGDGLMFSNLEWQRMWLASRR